jgi:hypothetical protein
VIVQLSKTSEVINDEVHHLFPGISSKNDVSEDLIRAGHLLWRWPRTMV